MDCDMLSALTLRNLEKCSNEDYLNYLSHLVADHLLKCRSNSSGDTKKVYFKIFPVGQKPEGFKKPINHIHQISSQYYRPEWR